MLMAPNPFSIPPINPYVCPSPPHSVAARGARVSILARNVEKLQKAAEEIHAVSTAVESKWTMPLQMADIFCVDSFPLLCE